MKLKIEVKEKPERDTVQLTFITSQDNAQKLRDEAHKRRISLSRLIDLIITKIMKDD